MTSDTIWQIIRYVLIAAGSFATGKGWVTADQVTQIIGALGTMFAVVWGIWVKFGTKATTADAAAKPTVPVVSPVTGAVK